MEPRALLWPVSEPVLSPSPQGPCCGSVSESSSDPQESLMGPRVLLWACLRAVLWF